MALRYTSCNEATLEPCSGFLGVHDMMAVKEPDLSAVGVMKATLKTFESLLKPKRAGPWTESCQR